MCHSADGLALAHTNQGSDRLVAQEHAVLQNIHSFFHTCFGNKSSRMNAEGGTSGRVLRWMVCACLEYSPLAPQLPHEQDANTNKSCFKIAACSKESRGMHYNRKGCWTQG